MKLLLLLIFFLGSFIEPLSAQHLKKDGTPDRRYRENRSTTYHPSTTYHASRVSHYTYRSSTSYHAPSVRTHHNGNYVYGVARDKNGRIKRSESAKREFMKSTGYPHGRRGYVVDHIVALKRGGCDCPSNMQWQTREAAREKDKRE